MSGFNAKSSRAKRPCPIWVDAFQRDTQHLSADEIGAYMLILMAMWTRESCDLPDDDQRLSRVARVSLRLWRDRIGPVIRAMLSCEGGMVFSKRLQQEAAYVEAEVQKQSDRKRGAYAKPQGDNDPAKKDSEKPGNQLKQNNVTSTADESVDDPRNHPSQQPNNLKVAVAREGATAPPLPERNPDARVKLLAAMGVGPDGVIGTSGFIGGMNDMAEADKWAALGLSLEDQCRLVSERAAAMRRKQPNWMPRTFSYFSPALAEFVARRSSPVTVPSVQTTETNDAASKRAFLRKVAGGEK